MVKKNWEVFVTSKTANDGYPGLRPVIYESWKRCKKAKDVDPLQLCIPEVLAGKSLEKKLAEKKTLIDIAKPVMQNLYKLVADSNFLISLSCENGYLLEIIGDKHLTENSAGGNFILGARWDEKNVGTNSIGTSIITNEPLQVVAYEHYCRWLHGWTGSSVPIKDSCTGKTIGVLSASGCQKKAHSHTLGMVYVAVNNIMKEVVLKGVQNSYEVLKSEKSLVAESASEAILTVDYAGLVTEINDPCCELLGVEKEDVIRRNARNLSPQNIKLQRILIENEEIFDQQITICRPHTPLKTPCKITSRFINGENGSKRGKVVVINKLKELQNYASTKKPTEGYKARFTFDDLAGQSPKFIKCIEMAKFAAGSDSNVLLLGESGTGKELVAQSIHNLSPRQKHPFIAINCAAMPRELIGSILFGYADGAYTGARKGGNIGKFELADGGTIFLDEIGDMPLELQPLFLRVLEEKRITRLGGKKSIPVDVRIISATNKKLDLEVEKGHFRSDLFYRINVLKINLPPLRERQEDIILLSKMFVKQISNRLNKPITNVPQGILKIFLRYSWPGNVRQLQNVIEQMINMARTAALNEDLVPEEIVVANNPHFSENILKKNEKQIILNLMQQHNHNVTNVAKQLCIARSTLYRKLKNFNINY